MGMSTATTAGIRPPLTQKSRIMPNAWYMCPRQARVIRDLVKAEREAET